MLKCGLSILCYNLLCKSCVKNILSFKKLLIAGILGPFITLDLIIFYNSNYYGTFLTRFSLYPTIKFKICVLDLCQENPKIKVNLRCSELLFS
jgi:hypothetical protein